MVIPLGSFMKNRLIPQLSVVIGYTISIFCFLARSCQLSMSETSIDKNIAELFMGLFSSFRKIDICAVLFSFDTKV